MSLINQVVWDPTKKFLATDEDRISNLPDSLICHILSCLPVKDAVRTSILSKDWEYNWTSIYNFDIIHVNSEGLQVATFVNFVERLLLHAQDIRSFKLSFLGESGTSRFASWISAALRHKIVTLKLNNHMGGRGEKKERDAAAVCFLNNSSLKELIVYYPCFQFPAMIYLPNLTRLDFCHVRILNENSNTDHLKYTFPVLKTLRLAGCKWLKVKLVEIHAPELTRFTSSGFAKLSAEAEDGYSIKVTGDKLEEFTSDCHLPDEAIVIGSRVVDATFRFHGVFEFSREKVLQVLRLLKGFSNLMKLKITNIMVELMRHWRQQSPFPKLLKLVQLDLEGPVYSEGLLRLLHAAPYLKFLSIFVKKKESWNHDDYDEVGSVPSCVVYHLKEVLFNYCIDEHPQYYLEKFLLRNGKELKKWYALTVNLAKDEVLAKLSAFPKVSTCLTICTPSIEDGWEISRKWETVGRT